MPGELLQAAATGAAGLVTGGGIAGLLRVKSQNRNTDANSAVELAHAYRLLVDDLRQASQRQDAEIRDLRKELGDVRTTKDAELAALRLELASERAEGQRLRQRVAELEQRVNNRSSTEAVA